MEKQVFVFQNEGGNTREIIAKCQCFYYRDTLSHAQDGLILMLAINSIEETVCWSVPQESGIWPLILVFIQKIYYDN